MEYIMDRDECSSGSGDGCAIAFIVFYKYPLSTKYPLCSKSKILQHPSHTYVQGCKIKWVSFASPNPSKAKGFYLFFLPLSDKLGWSYGYKEDELNTLDQNALQVGMLFDDLAQLKEAKNWGVNQEVDKSCHEL